MTNEWTPLACPLPGCGAALHLVRSTSLGLTRGVIDPGDDTWTPRREDADTGTWKVECEEGHVVLVPGPLGCPCGADDCDHHGFDTDEQNRDFHRLDVERLADVLRAFEAVRS